MNKCVSVCDCVWRSERCVEGRLLGAPAISTQSGDRYLLYLVAMISIMAGKY